MSKKKPKQRTSSVAEIVPRASRGSLAGSGRPRKSGGAAKPERRRPSSAGPNANKSAGATIEIIARGLLIEGSRVLMCENTKHGYLYLPGGHVEFSESAATALRREFLEETGRVVRVLAPAMIDEGVFDTNKRRHHEINLTFHVELVDARPARTIASAEKGIAFRWVELAAVPELDIRPLAAKAFLASGGQGPGRAKHDWSNGNGAYAEWISAID